MNKKVIYSIIFAVIATAGVTTLIVTNYTSQQIDNFTFHSADSSQKVWIMNPNCGRNLYGYLYKDSLTGNYTFTGQSFFLFADTIVNLDISGGTSVTTLKKQSVKIVCTNGTINPVSVQTITIIDPFINANTIVTTGFEDPASSDMCFVSIEPPGHGSMNIDIHNNTNTPSNPNYNIHLFFNSP